MDQVEQRVWADLTAAAETQHGWLEGGDLPDGLQDGAAKRLGYLGLVVAGILSVFFFVFSGWIGATTGPLAPQTKGSMLVPIVGVSVGLVVSLVLFLLSRRRNQDPRTLLKLGTTYQVLIAFDIALMSTMVVLVRETVVHGAWSGVAVWVLIFAAIVPSSPGRTLWVSTLSALMHPLALGTLWVAGYPMLPAGEVAQLFLPSAAAVIVVVLSSRISFRVGKALEHSRRMGSYELTELLGRGGMGEVWMARHMTLARPAAVKLIRAEALGATVEDSARVVRRFEREAQATAALDSENTITVYDFGVSQDGSFFYVMELLDGLDLEEIVRRFGRLSPERTVYLLLQVCNSLAEAHHNGLIHRDIKPANIYICRRGLTHDRVKVLDFGLVKYDFEPEMTLTLDNTLTGTPAYMAPEMVRGEGEVGAGADLYLVGCVAYWMLTGQTVFAEKSAVASLLAHAQKQPVPPSQRTDQSIPPELERVVLSCLEKDPDRRPENVADLAEQLAAVAFDQPWTSDRALGWWASHDTRRSDASRQDSTRSRLDDMAGPTEDLPVADTVPIPDATRQHGGSQHRSLPLADTAPLPPRIGPSDPSDDA